MRAPVAGVPPMKTSLFTLLLLVTSYSTPAKVLYTVSITRTVSDQNGAIIPGAQVSATLATTKMKRTTTSRADGIFKFIQLAPGPYIIRVELDGFAPQETSNIATTS